MEKTRRRTLKERQGGPKDGRFPQENAKVIRE